MYRQPSKQPEDWFYLDFIFLNINITHIVGTKLSSVVDIPFGSQFLKCYDTKLFVSSNVAIICAGQLYKVLMDFFFSNLWVKGCQGIYTDWSDMGS